MRECWLLFLGAMTVASCSNGSKRQSLRLNDVHAKLNETSVRQIIYPQSVEEIQHGVLLAKTKRWPVSISGGRHSMGGQQFGKETLHLSMLNFNQVLSFDETNGVVEVQSGIQWPELIRWLVKTQEGKWPQWGLRQKQTGADRLSIGGAVSSNVHGRGLTFKPFVDDLVSFSLVTADGGIVQCSRSENRELFRLVVGGYGLFGVIGTVNIQLVKRQKLERVVEMIDAKDVIQRIERRIKEGYLYGDFQFTIDGQSPDFLNRGVFSTYRPIPDDSAMPTVEKELSTEDWKELFYKAHTDKANAFDQYTTFYLSSSGQRYWSDTHQMGAYVDDYHVDLDKRLGASVPGSEMISEVYVPRNRLATFLKNVAQDFRSTQANVIYGTVRFIEKDDVSFLAWAKDQYACIVFNLHVEHSMEGIERAKNEFQLLIDRALENGGNYFLTYHRWARKDQVLMGYPQFIEFLQLKRKYDPDERFQSDWYRHYKEMFEL